MKAVAAFACLVALAGAAGAQTVLYDTFNEDDQGNLFDCCKTVIVSAKHSADGRRVVAVPFTPAVDASITEVDVALSFYSGENRDLELEVHSTTGGVPGRLKKLKYLVAAPDGGQCCQFESLEVRGIAVKAGKTYWIVIRAGADRVYNDRIGGWNLNSLGLTGSFDTLVGDNGAQWAPQQGTLPVMRILGTQRD